MFDDLRQIGTRAFLQLTPMRTDEHEAGNAFALAAERSADARAVGCPARDPAPDEAMGMGRVQQVHRHRARAQFLFP